MFPYADPTGTDFLQSQNALTTYRGRLTSQYDASSKINGTKFVSIAALSDLKPGTLSQKTTVTWVAFPSRSRSLPNEQVDRERSRQEEYVEWVVQRNGEALTSVIFTTEFSAYFQTLAELSFEALVAAVREVIPAANPTVRELLGVDQRPTPLVADGVVGAATWTVLEEVLDRPVPSSAQVLRRGSRGDDVVWLQTRLIWLGLLAGQPDGDFGSKTEAAVIAAQRKYLIGGDLFRKNLANNPWNTGQKGVLCLANRDNTLPLLFGLVSNCAVPRPHVRPQEVCSLVGSINCVPGRSSDPFACINAQTLALNGNVLSLSDPVGINILKLQGIWRINGQQIDINDSQRNQGVWQVSRGRQRAVLRNIPGLTLDGAPIRTGSQVAKSLQVGVDVVFAPPSALNS